uniref:DJ-1/PfpI domain-containing protein n=1 Tax=Heterosigma akashiwo TaxID=2829 RepID=A0A6S9E808_HETAK
MYGWLSISAGGLTYSFAIYETAAKKVLVPIADGSEEIESVTIIDTLVRAGAEVTVASVSPELQVTCSRGVKLVADKSIADAAGETYDAIACPGGLPGANHLRDDPTLRALLQAQNEAGRLVAAVCAAPAVVLQTHGLIAGRAATCYPADQFKSAIENYSTDPVVVSGNLVTSQGPGTSLAFALALVAELYGEEKASELKGQMLF